MELFIDDIPRIGECDNADFLFQVFKMEQVEFLDFEEDRLSGKIKVEVTLSANSKLNMNLQKDKFTKELSKIYEGFYKEMTQYEKVSCYFLIPAAYYEDWLDEELDSEKLFRDIKKDINRKFAQSRLVYLPNDLTHLIGRSLNGQSFFQATDALRLLQDRKSDYEFLEKAPMDIGLMFVVGTSIMGVQVFLWNRIGIALNTYYYARQYSSFFWSFGITIIFFSIIILLLFIPLFFSLRSGFKDFAKWIKLTASNKKKIN